MTSQATRSARTQLGGNVNLTGQDADADATTEQDNENGPGGLIYVPAGSDNSPSGSSPLGLENTQNSPENGHCGCDDPGTEQLQVGANVNLTRPGR